MLTGSDALDLLHGGEIEVLGLLPYSSNYVFLARVCVAGTSTLAVYKPRRGERPLWDFPAGTLAAREVASFLVSRASGWDIVPPTVLRASAPLGAGSVQLFIEHDPDRHYFEMVKDRTADLSCFAAFDVVVNNADRKSGHVLEDPRGRLWAVDHGVTFNVEPKLRTVIWAFAGEPLSHDVVDGLEALGASLDGGGLREQLDDLLAPAELDATRARIENLLTNGEFPCPDSDYHLPWPLI